MSDLSIAAKILGAKGGKKTLQRKGKKHFSEMGKKSAEVKKIAKISQNNR